MVIFKTASQLQTYLRNSPGYPDHTGFVPTMGALHEGHLSLIAASREKQGLTVASIFVNPTQFNDPADFNKYPVTLDSDIKMLEIAGCDVLFLPDVKETYPRGTGSLPHYDLGILEKRLEGLHRPGHFQGVCQVVDRLLEIVQAAHLYLGRKDYQQCLVIQKLIDLTERKIALHKVPTVREENGLAMSSRNMRLGEGGKIQAGSIYRQMTFIRENIHDVPLDRLIEIATHQLLQDGFEKVDYIAIVDPETLSPIMTIKQSKPLVILVAAYLNGVRLIDNMEINPK